EDEFKGGEQVFREAKELLAKHHLDVRATESQLLRAATAGMVSDGGKRKWDALLSPNELAELKSGLAGELVGVGVVIRKDEQSGVVNVLDVLPGSSAERGGLQPGDSLLKVDGRFFKGEPLDEIVARVRGKEGTSVSLTTLRADNVFDVKLTRRRVQIPSVTAELTPGGVALVRINAFSEQTPADLRRALDALVRQNPRGLVLDLRDNAGGLFDRMMDCAGMVLSPGATLASLVDRSGLKKAQVARGQLLVPVNLPTAVLVDSETASSAEILAAALKYGRKAKVIGRKTGGKWNVQRVEPLSNGWALKYTVGVFEAPWGEKLDGVGLTPDLEVEETKELERTRSIKDWAERLKADPTLRTAIASVSP
ncbi:MAG: S41 family peptidase, partial [Myxococcaceae bacterium]